MAGQTGVLDLLVNIEDVKVRRHNELVLVRKG